MIHFERDQIIEKQIEEKFSRKCLRILLAENSEINRIVAKKILERVGHEVETAPNGVVALDLLESRQFDLVLMDVHMPELDGLETTREIRTRESGRPNRTTVIAISAGSYEDLELECQDAGMDGFLPKPVQNDSLLALLELIAS